MIEPANPNPSRPEFQQSVPRNNGSGSTLPVLGRCDILGAIRPTLNFYRREWWLRGQIPAVLCLGYVFLKGARGKQKKRTAGEPAELVRRLLKRT